MDLMFSANRIVFIISVDETPHAYLLLDGHNKKTTLSTERYRTCNEEERADSISPGKVVAP